MKKLVAGYDLDTMEGGNATLLKSELIELNTDIYYSVRFYNKTIKKWIELGRLNYQAAVDYFLYLKETNKTSIYCLVEITPKYSDVIKLCGPGT